MAGNACFMLKMHFEKIGDVEQF
ncbi:hypothetical protein AA0017_11015 [Alkalihalobacillus sp. 1P02AB]